METLKWILVRCWPLSEHCAVEWDAWAVLMAFLAFAASVFLGVMTLLLGRAANRASAAAVGLAAIESRARVKRDHEESLILLMRLTGEMADAHTTLEIIQDQLSTAEGQREFLYSQDARDEVFEAWSKVRFPNYEACTDRLHYLPLEIAARMARVVGLRGSFQAGTNNGEAPLASEATRGLDAMRFICKLLLADLDVIGQACMAAVAEIGLSDEAVVAESERFRAG